MRIIALSMIGIAGLAACGVTDAEPKGEVSQEIRYGNDIFYENFNSLAPGPIAGQRGWELSPGANSSCVVVPTNTDDKNLECTNDVSVRPRTGRIPGSRLSAASTCGRRAGRSPTRRWRPPPWPRRAAPPSAPARATADR